LRLNPLHPDRNGGLGFLSSSLVAFVPLLVSQTVLLSGSIADQIHFAGKTLPQFKVEIGAICLFLLVTVLFPLIFFMPRRGRAKRKGEPESGGLASRYVRDFNAKWLQPAQPHDEALLGTADLQSLADLASGYDPIREMKPLVFKKDHLIGVVVAMALPLAP